jgi:hypothetical protein
MVQRWWSGAWVGVWGGLLAGASIFSPAAAAVDLTATERTWLEAAIPVLSFARVQRLPLDIIVQPQPTPGESPMGMAFVDGRCKLVLSMRGNAAAQATLEGMPPDLVGPIVESLAAHELGHCWRHLQRDWGTLPAGLHEAPRRTGVTAEQMTMLSDMWSKRREEAFADLVGLAWTLQHHRDRFTAVHAWYVGLRSEQAVETGPHDTRLWVQLAGDPAGFAPGASIFEHVVPLWVTGLLAER